MKELRQTCPACPSQWEGRTDDNRPIYIRYRWGCLGIGIGKPDEGIKAAVKKEMFTPDLMLEIGGCFDGQMEESEMLPYLYSAIESLPTDTERAE